MMRRADHDDRRHEEEVAGVDGGHHEAIGPLRVHGTVQVGTEGTL